MGHGRSLIDDLITARKKWGLSRADLAELLGFSETTIQHWELMSAHPSFENLIRWADALGYDLVLQFRKSR